MSSSPSLLSTLLRFRGTRPPPPPPVNNLPFTAKTNPYRAKRQWPPDFTQLSPKHQFRLERRYRRRAKLKWARPNWTKGVKLVQWGSILFVLGYGVLWMEMGDQEEEGGKKGVFDGIRLWVHENTGLVPAPGKREREGGDDDDGASPVVVVGAARPS